mmetsp:Transcript_31496/g.53154  ORF Transcript_31496/g.53154 Transcript_31496/m.53154 type:complete len:593 (-) Transcript_31496:185-1963(-)
MSSSASPSIKKEEYTAEGCNYGMVDINGSSVVMTSVVSKKPMFNFRLENVAQCVVQTAGKRDDLEMQFVEPEKADKHEDCLVQMTFHFPAASAENENEDEPALSLAENFHKTVMDTGIITSVTGNIIAEFTKEQGNFVTPRGKYSIQMTATYMHMQGAQYAYKIKYEDIGSLFLLPKADGGRMAFVISLEKPIRQGNQRYLNLVLETHKVEHTMTINLSEEDCTSQYDGQLAPEMTMPMSSLIATVFKVLAQKKVFVPKQFLSARDAHCVRCSIKANEGLLYPLAKAFIFINKPCLIIKFDDIDYIEFERYEPTANSATRNFDLVIYIKDTGGSSSGAESAKDREREHKFMSIDRSEFVPLIDYINAKAIKVKNPVERGGPASGGGAYGGKARMDEVMAQLDAEGDDDASDEDESDDDYDGGGNSSHSAGSDDSGDDSDASGSGGEEEDGGKKTSKKRGSGEMKTSKKKSKKSSSGGDDDGKKKKKKRAKKDPNAPKGALSAFMFFSSADRKRILAGDASLSMVEVSKVVGTHWREMTAEQKAPYEEQARADKQRYAEEMAAFKQGGGGAGGAGDDDDDADGEEAANASEED